MVNVCDCVMMVYRCVMVNVCDCHDGVQVCGGERVCDCVMMVYRCVVVNVCVTVS